MEIRRIISVYLLLLAFLLPQNLSSQIPTYVWAEMLQGNVESIQRNVAVDASGNVYIHGVFFGTVDFDPSSGTYNVTPVPYGCNVYIAKYDANGIFLWVKNIPINASYGGNSMTMDASGNIYIAGFYSGSNVDFNPNSGTAYLSSVSGSNDIYFAKYDANGNYLWAKSIGSTGSDGVSEILTDASGNIFLTGTFSGTADFNPDVGTFTLTSSGTSDVFIAKYSSGGSYLWAEQIGGSNTEDVRDIAIDGSGNIFLTGSFYGTADFDPGGSTANLTSAGFNDVYFAKYDANGNYLWAKQIGSTSYDIGSALAADVNGNVFLTGTFNGTVDLDPGLGVDNCTAALGGGSFFGEYDANGNYVWAFALPLNTSNINIMLDNCSSLYISGSYLSGGASSIDMDPGPGAAMISVPGSLPPPYYNVFARYDLNGNFLWAKGFGQSCYCTVSGYKASLATDASGYIYYSGIFDAPWFSTSTVDFDPGSGVANLTATSQVDNTFFAKYQCTVILLPIELISFYGENLNGVNRLHWSTASEINNHYFEIERSIDAESFESIGTVEGHGNSDLQTDYSFDDHQPANGINYYRLKQVDFDGGFTFSDVIFLQGEFSSQEISFSTIAPGQFILHFPNEKPQSFKVYNENGELIYQAESFSDSENVQLDLRNQSNGIYLVTAMMQSAIRSVKLMVNQ